MTTLAVSRNEGRIAKYWAKHPRAYYRWRTIRNTLDTVRYTELATLFLLSQLIQYGQPVWSIIGLVLGPIAVVTKLLHASRKYQPGFLYQKASTPEEAITLLQDGYEYVTTVGQAALFKKKDDEVVRTV